MTAQSCMARKMCRHIRFTNSYNTIYNCSFINILLTVLTIAKTNNEISD